jgi:drug/metabolite transporter (DMT)-like permease
MNQLDGAGANRPAPLSFWHRLSPNLRGMALMAISAGAVATLHTIARALTADYHSMQIAFVRTTVPLIFLVPMLIHQGRRTGTKWWSTTRPGLQFVRGAVGAVAMMTWFLSLSMIPVGDATAITFSVVIFASIGAVLFLGERIGPRRIAAIVVGLIGTLIIVRPDVDNLNMGAMVALVSSIFWGTTLLIVKVLARTESSPTIVFYASVYFTVFVTPFAVYYWNWPTPEDMALMVLTGILALVGQLALTGAMRSGEATAVVPVDFTRLLWAAGIGYFWFGEFPDLWTWVGGAVVFASTLYITYRESRLRKPVVAEEPVVSP